MVSEPPMRCVLSTPETSSTAVSTPSTQYPVSTGETMGSAIGDRTVFVSADIVTRLEMAPQVFSDKADGFSADLSACGWLPRLEILFRGVFNPIRLAPLERCGSGFPPTAPFNSDRVLHPIRPLQQCRFGLPSLVRLGPKRAAREATGNFPMCSNNRASMTASANAAGAMQRVRMHRHAPLPLR
jgi:hypothetical protein